MSDMVIQYNYHDAYIDAIQVSEGEVACAVVLYSIYYPGAPTVQLRWSGIYNDVSVCCYFQSILDEGEANGDLGCGIRTLHYDTKKLSSPGDIFMYLETDWEGSQRIYCKEFTEVEQ